MDRRPIKTVSSIKKALISLIRTKKISEIKVIDICNKANVSRSTFYLHFADINDLIDQIEEEQIEPIFRICLGFHADNIKEKCTEIARFIKKNCAVFKLLLLKTDDHFENKFKNKIDKLMIASLGDSKKSTFTKYYFSFILNGASGVFKSWILDDCAMDECEIIDNFISYIRQTI